MDRPRVVTFAYASVDGRVAVSPGRLLLYGDERWSLAAGYESDVETQLRTVHDPQVILEGSGSFVTDSEVPWPLPPPADPASADYPYDDYLPDAIVSRPDHRGWFAVVDGRGRIRWTYKEWPDEKWRGWHLLVLASRSLLPSTWRTSAGR